LKGRRRRWWWKTHFISPVRALLSQSYYAQEKTTLEKSGGNAELVCLNFDEVQFEESTHAVEGSLGVPVVRGHIRELSVRGHGGG
jgi:hypothetical protein